MCAFPQHKCEEYIVVYLHKCLTCKKASEEFIDSGRQFLVTVVGIEIHFPANGDTVHVHLHKQTFSTPFTDYFARDHVLMSIGGWFAMAVAASEIFPEHSQWRPPNNWSWSSPIKETLMRAQNCISRSTKRHPETRQIKAGNEPAKYYLSGYLSCRDTKEKESISVIQHRYTQPMKWIFSNSTVGNTSDDDCPQNQENFQIIKMCILPLDDLS